jgi:hypothetical protein
VAEFLSAEWIAAVDAAVRSAPDLAADPPIVVETIVRDDDGPERGYQLRIDADGASVARGRKEHVADVVLVTNAATAWALHQGTVRAQDAFTRGELKVRGRPEILAGRTDLFARLERALAPVRAGTTPTAAR